MPRREILSPAQREALLVIPVDRAGLIEHYVLSEQDLSLIRQRRGDHNRLGIAVQQSLARPEDFTNTVPEEATALLRQAYALLPHIKIIDLLLEVDRWTGFSRYFTHLKTGQPCEDRTLLLTAILADAITHCKNDGSLSGNNGTQARLARLAARP